MVWRSTTKVGFGVKGKWVIAWYCEVAGNTNGKTGYEANVGKDCVADGYNKCYADKALAAHNLRRGYHESSPLELDVENSKALQTLMDEGSFEGAVDGTSLPTGCGQSSFTQDDPTKVATLATSDDATEGWYSGKKYYSFKEGKYVTDVDGDLTIG
jgi:hypothetical protein